MTTKQVSFLLLLLVMQANLFGQTQVEANTYPYCFVVKLLMYKGGSQYHGTGVLIDETHILTNAHNVIDKDSIKVISGYNDKYIEEVGNTIIKCEKHKTIFYDDNFDSKNHYLYDFAILKYKSDSLWNKIMKITDNKKFTISQNGALNGGVIHIAGYPYFRFFELGKPKKAKVQYSNSTDRFQLLPNGLINYKLNTRGGSSGSPIWIEQNGNLILVGIHKSGKRMNNQGIYYSKERVNIIKGWMNQK